MLAVRARESPSSRSLKRAQMLNSLLIYRTVKLHWRSRDLRHCWLYVLCSGRFKQVFSVVRLTDEIGQVGEYRAGAARHTMSTVRVRES